MMTLPPALFRALLASFILGLATLAPIIAAEPAAVPAAAAAVDCKGLFEEHLKTDLALTYEQFDQTPGKGFRVLAEAGCNREGAELIALYIEKNQAKESSLVWHLAQLSASAGDYPRAIENARKSLRANEDFAANPLRWNDYVLATIAFLERDRERLIEHRNRVAEGVEAFWGNKLNLKLLDALIRHFDQSYAYATSHIEEKSTDK